MVSLVVLVATAWFIYQQTKATKELVENDSRPVIEVGLLYMADSASHLQFINLRKIPALVWVEM